MQGCGIITTQLRVVAKWHNLKVAVSLRVVMKRCKICVMPDTKPGVFLDKEGVCQACRHAEKKKQINWDNRLGELKKLCDRYRNSKGDYYDCIITVSGGKDSHFQVYMMKEVMKMNPLLINVDNFSWTKTGRQNFYNMSEAFGCDIISLSLNRKVARKFTRKAFEKLGSPNWYWDLVVYTYPIRIAINMGIPLIVYGENVAYEYGGVQKKETYSAKDQINNDVVKDVGGLNFWLDEDITMKDLNPCIYPTMREIREANLEPIYLSYFVPWDGYNNYQLARKYGFKSLGDTDEWKREGYIDDYDQIDAIGYLVHPWLKYPKFGFARATDVCCYWIRSSRITREEALKLVEKHDHRLDPKVLGDFLEFTGYSEKEFWGITERFINKDVWGKAGDHEWKLKDAETNQTLKTQL